MNYVDYRFGLDVEEIGSQVYLTVKEGDTARRLNVYLTAGHEPYEIDEGCVAVFAAAKADGNVIFNNCSIDGNSIIYEFTEQTVAAVGNMKCELRLYKDEKLLASPNFTIAVLPKAVDDAGIESLTEVNTLTSLINEAATLIAEVNADLENGAFVPEFTIGVVETLPAGANATASITGTGKEPVLNLGIPQGQQGQAESLIPDTELSTGSTKPVQNKVIAEEFAKVRAEQTEYAAGVADSFAIVGENLEKKVDEVTGKGLSTNDFTNELKEKLEGIEAGANKYELGEGAVTAAKIAAGAVSQSEAVTLLAASWVDNAQTVNVACVTADNPVFVSAEPGADNYAAYTENAVRCTAQAAGTLTFVCESAPSTDVTVNVTVINK